MSNAAKKAQQARQSGDPNASLFERVASGSVGYWLGWDNPGVTQDIRNYLAEAKAAKKIPVLVVYNAPNRDCGNYSAGGSANFAQYFAWIDRVVAGIGGDEAWVVFEPDIIPLDCQKSSLRNFAEAINRLKNAAKARVYIDIGHAKWLSVDEAVIRLNMAGIGKADGFALNVSNYYDNALNVEFGRQVSSRVKKPFIIDTSRNGRGSSNLGGEDSWCNPKGRGLGLPPTTTTGISGVDAFIWVKNPGESDGDCKRGEPKAGDFWPEMALELARNAVSEGRGVMGDDGIHRECRANQIFVDSRADVICDKGCLLQNKRAECKDGVSHWPANTPGPDGILRECRGKQIFVNNKPDVICELECYMKNYEAKCKDDKNFAADQRPYPREPTYFSKDNRMYFTEGNGSYCVFVAENDYLQHEVSYNHKSYKRTSIAGELNSIFTANNGNCAPLVGTLVLGNNGVQNCQSWCRSQINKSCIASQRRDTMQYLSCAEAPGLLANKETHVCICSK
jgi:endoglucanase